jgi:hypothetical protein
MGVIINGGMNIGNGGILISPPYIPPFLFSIVRDGLVLELDAGNINSYPGSGTTWTDISGNGNNATLINGPTFSSNNGGLIILDGIDDFVSIPGNATIYTSNFTWQSFHYIRTANAFSLDAMWWSEDTVKNFLMVYRNTNSANAYFRIDTQTQVFESYNTGTQTNGFGTTAGPVSGRWILTTIVKNGTTFSLYWNNAVLMWTVTIGSWNIVDNTQAIAFGARNDNVYNTAMDISNNLMYNRALSTLEITQNYDVYKSRFGL